MRILIVKLSAIGDTALALPLLSALRLNMPDAFIGWVVGGGAAPLLAPFADAGDIDRVHVWRKSEQSLRGALRLAREIRGAGYDVSLDAQCLTKSAMIPFLARIRRRVGFERGYFGGRELSTFLNNEFVPAPSRSEHVLSQTLRLGTALGLGMPETMPVDMRIDPGALERMRTWWRGERLGKKALVFGIGAGWPTKVLPVETVADLARAAGEKGRRSVVVWGPPEEAELPRWREAFGGDAAIAPRTDVKELVALLSLAERYAGPDSAGLHIAALLGKPTFSWFGASDPVRCAPRGERDRHVTRDLDCRPCWKRRCRSSECVREFRAEEILPAFGEWLGGR